VNETALTPDQVASFHTNGFLVLRGAVPTDTVSALRDAVGRFERHAVVDGPGMHHFEQTEAGPRLARSEDLIPHDDTLRSFICGGDLLSWLGDLFGEPAVLYKEKVNYKHPGGGGFAPHQDATAYRFVDRHISAMVPLDPATVESGCLSVAPGHTRGILPNTRGTLDSTVSESLDWAVVEVLPGDVLIFDSYAPHKSGTNRSAHPRRALYLTYNARSAGDFRDRYYADKKAEFAAADGTFGGDRVRISVNDDFLGKPVSAPGRDLSDLLARYDGPQAQQLYDEEVTELVHGLQCAEVALADGADEATIAASLLHDVGHLLVGDLFPIDAPLDRDWKHEDVGARYLAKFFGPEVTEPVRMHVAAKRYLVATDAAYAATLTPSSVRSLAVQGGPMTEAEQRAFEALPGFARAVKVRRYDDLGKDPEMRTRPFRAFVPMLERLTLR
jgi:predicted HD phosphohydrolase/ectoine hydroxylase-related dioxygenase (phytanoyl-CoA dioxygenase family)